MKYCIQRIDNGKFFHLLEENGKWDWVSKKENATCFEVVDFDIELMHWQAVFPTIGLKKVLCDAIDQSTVVNVKDSRSI